MTKKKPKKSNTPKCKRLKREQQLESAKSWLPTYEGKNVFRGYRKRYGVDWPTSGRGSWPPGGLAAMTARPDPARSDSP